MCCNKLCIQLFFLYLRMLYYIIIIKITYSIYLLVFRYACKRIDLFVSLYYKKEILVAAYSGLLYLVCHPNEWNVLESIRSVVANPSIWQKQAGRLWTTRISSTGKKGRRRHQVCSNYRQVWHNRINCT